MMLSWRNTVDAFYVTDLGSMALDEEGNQIKRSILEHLKVKRQFRIIKAVLRCTPKALYPNKNV